MGTIQLLLYLHILGLFILGAGVGVANLSGIMSGKVESPREIAMWSGINHKVEHIAILPGALILLVTGSLLVDKNHFEYSAGWIQAAYGLWVLSVILGAGVLGRHAKAIHKLATERSDSNRDEELMRLARSPKGPIVGNLLNVIVLLFLWLMIYKPGA